MTINFDDFINVIRKNVKERNKIIFMFDGFKKLLYDYQSKKGMML